MTVWGSGWVPDWALDWALGPSGRRGVPPYVSRVDSGTGKEEAGYADDTETHPSARERPAGPGGEHHEQLDQHHRRVPAGPRRPQRQGPDGGRVPGHHRGGRGDRAGDHGDGHRSVDLRRHHGEDRRSHRRLMRRRKYHDAGQAFPIYITVVGGLLFLAFAYLAVGQAAATRNGAQTAADAAALAAAQDLRDKLAGQWVED